MVPMHSVLTLQLTLQWNTNKSFQSFSVWTSQYVYILTNKSHVSWSKKEISDMETDSSKVHKSIILTKYYDIKFKFIYIKTVVFPIIPINSPWRITVLYIYYRHPPHHRYALSMIEITFKTLPPKAFRAPFSLKLLPPKKTLFPGNLPLAMHIKFLFERNRRYIYTTVIPPGEVNGTIYTYTTVILPGEVNGTIYTYTTVILPGEDNGIIYSTVIPPPLFS